MNILILNDDFPPTKGGIAVFLSELSTGLVKKGNAVTVLVKEMPDFEEYDERQSYPVIRYSISRRLNSLRICWQLFRQIMRVKPDILFMGGVLATRGLPVLPFRWFLRIPYVVLCHDGNLGIAKASILNKISVYTLMKNAKLILANSGYTRRLLIERGFSNEKIRILTPGIDINFFSPLSDEAIIKQIRSKYGADGVPLLVNVGRLVPKKNQKGIIRAIAKLRNQKVPVKCIIAGDGPERENLENIIEELEIGKHISLIGPVSRKIVRELFQAADIVILPSIIHDGNYESFGIVAIEASACGKPVIIGSKGGQGDTVIPDKTGIIVDAEDYNNIAKAITYLIDRRDIGNRMGKAGRRHVVENFSWDKIAERAANLLSEVN